MFLAAIQDKCLNFLFRRAYNGPFSRLLKIFLVGKQDIYNKNQVKTLQKILEMHFQNQIIIFKLRRRFIDKDA